MTTLSDRRPYSLRTDDLPRRTVTSRTFRTIANLAGWQPHVIDQILGAESDPKPVRYPVRINGETLTIRD